MRYLRLFGLKGVTLETLFELIKRNERLQQLDCFVMPEIQSEPILVAHKYRPHRDRGSNGDGDDSNDNNDIVIRFREKDVRRLRSAIANE